MNEIDINNLSPEVRLYLCKPDRTIIDELKNVTNRNLKVIFGGINQLSFNVPYKIMKHNKMIHNPLVDSIRGDYLVKFVRDNLVDYYIISNPESSVDNSGIEHLSILCHQQQYEWKDKLVRLFTGTKLLYNPIGNTGVLNETLLTKTDWSVSSYDSELINKYRTFDESETSLLDFTYSSMERYGDFVPVINTVDKQVSIVKTENVALDRGLSMTVGKYLKGLTYVENFEDIVTRLYVYGKSGISINSVSPSGMDFIENFSFYMNGYEEDELGNVISSSPYMSDSLCHAIIQYNQLLETKATDFANLLSQKSGYQTSLITKRGELTDLNSELGVLLDTKDTLIATGGSLTTINSQIVAKTSQITSKQSEISVLESNINAVDNDIQELRIEISEEQNFTSQQIIEKNKFIKEKTWSDETYTEPSDLFEEGKARLARLSQPIVSYTIDSIDFLSALNTPLDWDKLRIGEIVTLEYPNFKINIKAMIVDFDWGIDDKSLKITIANHKDIKTGFLKYKDLLKTTTHVSTQVDMSKFKWDLSETNNTQINQIMNNKWDATKQAVTGGKNENFIINERGATLTNTSDPNKILRLLSSTIAMSGDGGNTYRLAIDSGGVVAQALYGTIIAGANLTIQNSSGTFSVDANGATLTNMDLTITRSDNKSRIKMNATSGILIQSSTNGTTWTDRLSADSSGNLVANSLTVSNINVTSGQISIGANFSVNSSGFLTASGATITGNITANAIVAGTSITSPSIIGGSISGTIITGGTIRTADSGSRIELSSNLLTSYNQSSQIHGVRLRTLSSTDSIPALEMYENGTRRGYIGAWGGILQIAFDSSGGNIAVSSGGTVFFTGNMNFNGANVVGVTAKFA